MQTHRRSVSFFLAMAASVVPFATAPAAPPTINGRIEQIGPFRVLRVWGTPEEMGFAHGYLLGRDYLEAAGEYLTIPKWLDLDALGHRLIGAIEFPPRARAEIESIYRGIVAAEGKVPTLPRVHRPLTADDLLLDNAHDLLRAFGCSGFTVWGDQAGEAGVITARNFDFYTPGPVSLGKQVILVREPTGRTPVATITWPGYIGVFTGINADGVCAFMHDGTGKMIREPHGRYTPAPLLLSQLLESSGPADAFRNAETQLKKIVPYPFSYLIRVVTPRVGGTSVPVRVFRIDGDGLSHNPVRGTSCVTTNHYLKPDSSAVEGAGGWSLLRYRTLAGQLTETLTPAKAWKALQTVTSYSTMSAFTLHALVVYPEKRSLDLAMASWDDQPVPAPNRKPFRISFDQLFGHGERTKP